MEFTDSLGNIWQALTSGVSEWGLKLIGGVFALVIGLFLIRMFMRAINKAFEMRKVDPTLKPFLRSLFGISLKVLLFVSVAGIVGIPTASFAALIAGVGIAIGAAFNGSLGHLASGVMILVFKPFKVGDLIEVDGTLGEVKEISMFVTILETFQNKTEIIPNSLITGSKITNITRKGFLRVDLYFKVQYDADLDGVFDIIFDTLRKDEKVLLDPEPAVVLNDVGDYNVEILVMPYTEVDNYWHVFWKTRKNILEALKSNSFEAPIPQHVVSMKNN